MLKALYTDYQTKTTLLVMAVSLIGFVSAEIGFGFWTRGIATDKNRRLALVGDINSCLACLIDCETGARGYLITNDKVFLQPFEHCFSCVRGNVVSLAKKCNDDSERAHVDALSELAADKVHQTQNLILYNSPNVLAYRKTEMLHGKKIMDAYRVETEAFLKDEEVAISREIDLVEMGKAWIAILRGLMLCTSLITILRLRYLENKLLGYLKMAVKSRDEAMDAIRVKTEFISTMSHEIRTPLAAVLGFAEIMIEEPSNEIAQLVYNQGIRLLAVVNDILDFSKLEAGMMSCKNAQFSVAVLLDNVITATRANAQKNQIKVTSAIRGPIYIYGDEVKLTQILMNLLSNAIKFTPGGVITIGASVGRTFSVAITDTGIGIDDKDVDMLFKPFSQLNNGNTRKYGGSGLGLSISKKLVELMGGTIHCTSVKGQGSTFWFDIPLS